MSKKETKYSYKVSDLKKFTQLRALIITLIFLLIGSLYIIFSENISETLYPDPVKRTQFHTWEGIVFTFIVAVFFFFVIKNTLNKSLSFQRKTLFAEGKFQSIFYYANNGIAIGNVDGKIIEANPEFMKLLGYSKSEILTMNFADFTYPDDISKEMSLYEKILQKEIDSYRIEKRYLKKNKEIIWVDLSVACNRNSYGNIEFFVGMVVDITQKKDLEQRLSLVNKAIENSLNAFDIVDSNGEFIYVNKSYVDMWGYDSAEEIIGTSPVGHCVDPEIPGKIISTLKEEGKIMIEFKAKRKDGSEFDVQMFANRVLDHKGQEVFMGTSLNITDRIHHEVKIMEFNNALSEQNKEYESLNEELIQTIEELRYSKEKAEEADRLKTVFLNNMSHEIRTPMNGIIGFTEFLDKEDLTDEKKKFYHRIIKNSGYQLLRIIDDILEISKLETKQVKVKKEVISLNHLLVELFSIFEVRARENGLPLYLKKGLNDRESTVLTDSVKLNKILSNLLDNALKYTISGFIEFGYNRTDEQLTIYVKDTGTGISEEAQEHIFNRFYREEKDAFMQNGGLGIGLSIAKENAILLGGDIYLETEKDKGSVFSVKIPYEPVKQEKDDESDGKVGPVTAESKQILVVEDEEVNYLFIEELINYNYGSEIELTHARDANEAMDQLKSRGNYDCILMDLKLPGKSGFDLTREILALYPDIPVVAVTAFNSENDRNKAFEAGCIDYIAKPVNSEYLDSVLKKVLIRN